MANPAVPPPPCHCPSCLHKQVFLKDMGDFAKFNTIYEKFYSPYKPARSCVEVARLPKDVLCELEFIAVEKK